MAIDLQTVAGERFGQTPTNMMGTGWSWTFEDMVVVNESDDPITCTAWLVVDTPDTVGHRELRSVSNQSVLIGARSSTHLDLEFRLDFAGFSHDDQLEPGSARELVLLEVGSRNRELRIPFQQTGVSNATPE